MFRTLTGVSALALMLASAAVAQDSHDHGHDDGHEQAGDDGVTLYRLFVGDH